MTTETKPDYRCTFCKRGSREVKMLIAGKTEVICDECVIKCYDLMLKTKAGEPVEMDEDEDAEIDVSTMPTPSEIKAYLDDYIVGQDHAKITVAVAAYNHYKRITHDPDAEVEIEKSNILLVGPTGCGKTLIAQSLARALDVPWVIADATSLTEAGYVGEDAEVIISRLLMNADGDVERAQEGIIFLDEIDKKKSQKASGGNRDISGEGVQQALLKLLEGTEVWVTPRGNRDGAKICIDTRNILFIVSGAFVGIDKDDAKSLGFGREPGKTAKEINSERLIEYGLIPELVGRIPVVAKLDELLEDQLVHVLTQPKNAITKQFRELFAIEGVELEFEPEALKEIARASIKAKTGARGLRGIIEKALLMTQYELPTMREAGAIKITVHAGVFTSGEAPKVTFRS